MRYFGLLLMVGGILMLMVGEIMMITEEQVSNIDVESSESIAWTVYAGIAATVAGLLFVINGKKRSFSLDKAGPFNNTILNI